MGPRPKNQKLSFIITRARVKLLKVKIVTWSPQLFCLKNIDGESRKARVVAQGQKNFGPVAIH